MNTWISFRRQREPWNPSGSLTVTLFLVAWLFTLSSPSSAETVTGIPRVIDADTVHLAGERIRLKDIDAPETRQQCLDGNGDRFPCGVVSKRMLEARVGSAAITCELDPKRDRYRRRLGTCYARNGENLHSWLVRNGLALAYPIYGPPPFCKSNFSLWKSWLQPSIRPVCEGLLPSGPDGIRAGVSLSSCRLQLLEPLG